MQKGFYLSPCGFHIVEISEYRINPHMELLVIDFKDWHIQADGFNIAEQYSILMSCWHYLGY